LWTAGRINSTIRRANAAYDATDARYRETVLGLAVETTQLYFDIARLTRREALITESLEEHRALVASMERRVAQEVSPLADLELARSRVAQIEQELTVSRAQRQASLFAFAELVSDPNYNIGNVPDYIDGLKLADREKVVDEALGFDPSLQRLSSEIRAGEAEVAATKASLFPQLNAQYTYNDIVGSRVGVVARLETSAGLSRFSAVSSARSRVDTSIAQLATAQRQIRQRINNDMTEFDAAQARASVSRNASFTASNVSQSYMRQFIAGRRSWLDVMNSLRETLSARLGQADAEISAMSSYVRLSLRTGRWSPFVDSAK
jgi:adhesin transport system outer membrane protein